MQEEMPVSQQTKSFPSPDFYKWAECLTAA